MNLSLSSTLAITKTSFPPMELIEKNMINPQSLTADQYQQAMRFAVALTALQDYASADDEVGIAYISKYFGYFCDHYNSYSLLPEGAKPSFQVAKFSSSDSFMGQAYSLSSCAQDYFDL